VEARRCREGWGNVEGKSPGGRLTSAPFDVEDEGLMARVFNHDTAAEDIRKNLARSFQSGNVNFLIGSGASYPAIPSAGAVEEEIAGLFEAGDGDAAYLKLYDFLATIQAPTNKLIASVP
jgi:hypothetical protein